MSFKSTCLPQLFRSLNAAKPSPTSASSVLKSTTPRFFSTRATSSSTASSSSPFARFSQQQHQTKWRSFTSQTVVRNGEAVPVDWIKLGKTAGLATIAVVGVNYALNRETRGALTEGESSYLHSTFAWTGAGLGLAGITGKLMHGNGFAARMMAMNPWIVMGAGLAASIGSMLLVFSTEPDSPVHYAAWATFSALQGVTLSPLFFISPLILSRAALYTGGALIPLTYVGTTAENTTFLYFGGVLLAGLGVLIATSLAPMILPRSVLSVRTLSRMEHFTAYGGVAIFSGLILYDTQKILMHANQVERGLLKRDPIRESVSLILDVINLFVKVVQVLLLQQRKK